MDDTNDIDDKHFTSSKDLDRSSQRQVRQQRRNQSGWHTTLGQTTSFLAIAGLLIYAISGLAYTQFYGSLSVEPADIGLGYANTLANTLQIIISSIVRYAILATLLLTITLLFGRAGQHMRQWLKNPRVIASLVLIILILEAVGRSLIAVSAAEAVKQGRPVIPSRYGPFLIGLGGGAQPVELKPTAKPGEAQAIESLQGRSLFYLGQANGTIVVYDSTNQHAIYIPTSSAIVEVVNCRTRSEIAACSDAYGR